jgi:ATP-dependent protease Clp ATPase subunit
MLDVMYDLPSNDKVAKCLVTLEAITGEGKPQLIEGERKKRGEGKGAVKSAKKIENAS